MHTTQLKDEQGRKWVINHNGDWSGDAYIKRVDGETIVEEYHVPGIIIRDACRGAVAGEIIGLIEQKFC